MDMNKEPTCILCNLPLYLPMRSQCLIDTEAYCYAGTYSQQSGTKALVEPLDTLVSADGVKSMRYAPVVSSVRLQTFDEKASLLVKITY
jgi:hypothetical protein